MSGSTLPNGGDSLTAANVSGEMGAGGACPRHGVYNGRRCPGCAETSAKAALRQSVWEATQWLDRGEVEAFVSDVLDEIRSDEP